ncbi:MAG: 2,4-dihydroxyhept-2-ene-1,7-dioic acid aldolase [Parcubacteria group bacterium GW2011_GWA2_49_9]|nr:MAG: 2,4-dihydroxyhept-2-ene-1,7-dioic acid aldolase [Parcubacteria group bacterium GW2011_GWA2_49_9]
MKKDFDAWNNNKKRIHADNENKLYHEREVWWCALGVNIGFEQDGTGIESDRPVLILKGFSSQVCLVVPLTTSKKKNPYHVSLGTIEDKIAFAIISQIRLIDTKRLINKIGFVDQVLFANVRKAVKGFL